MLTKERSAALVAVQLGEVTVRGTQVSPQKHTVAVGFLRKADLVSVDEYGDVKLTARGNRVFRS